MSTFGDYKSYKKYEPAYANWKNKRDIQESKRMAYLKQNPNEMSKEDIQRGQALVRAIDIMDEYSQKRAQDVEVATQSVVSMALEFMIFAGMGLGALVGKLKPVNNLISKHIKNKKHSSFLSMIIPVAIGGALGTIASFPLQAWGAKAEVSASRRGRFEAMRNELKNPNGFAVLTDEQIAEARKNSKNIVLDEDKKINKMTAKLSEAFGIGTLKSMALDGGEYKKQRTAFERELASDNAHINDKMSPKDIEKAKKDQQLLTKLVEKIDIASQDYAENAELAAGTFVTGVMALSFLGDLAISKLMKMCKVQSAQKISVATKIAGLVASIGAAIWTSQIIKQASKVGRYKVKQELMQNPEAFVYVDDKKANEVKDFEINTTKKQSLIEFLKSAYKNNKEYEKHQKATAKDEKRFYKAIEDLELSEEQIKDAKQLQKNAFRTFNKVDDNSQKYSESVEALGQASMFPINLICTSVGMAIGIPLLLKKSKTSLQEAEKFAKYFGITLLSSVPAVLANAYITKQQKKASRVADMLAINEMQDYRNFK
mgnify:CR=1 FL=1